jgi:hypothetical protein
MYTRGNPAAEVGTRRFHTSQKLDRLSIHERHVREIEKDEAIGLGRYEPLQLGDMSAVHLSAENEGQAPRTCRAFDSMRHSHALHSAEPASHEATRRGVPNRNRAS